MEEIKLISVKYDGVTLNSKQKQIVADHPEFELYVVDGIGDIVFFDEYGDLKKLTPKYELN